MITDTRLLNRFEKEGGMEYFDDRDSVHFLLDLAKCPGNHEEISKNLLNEFGSLKGVLEARKEQLQKVDGLEKHTALMIRSVVPFIRTWERMTMTERSRIGNSTEAEHYCKSLVYGLRNERFYVICLNSRCHILGQRVISDGSINEVSTYPRVVVETALNYNAFSILLCHNHPGGTNAPSPEDISSTITLQKTLNAVGIMLLDHIIVAGCDTYSMVQHGDIDYRMRR